MNSLEFLKLRKKFFREKQYILIIFGGIQPYFIKKRKDGLHN